MKKAIKILTLLLALALVVSTLAIAVFATDDCEVAERNVAGEAIVTGDPTRGYQGKQVHWMVSDHLFAVNDNDPTTVCPIDTNNGSANYGIFMDFDTPYQFTKLVIQTYGVGRAISSTVSTDRVSGVLAVYDLNVEIRDALGGVVFSGSHTTSKDNIVFEIPDNVYRGCQIYIWFDKVNGGWGQGIWEVEAYTTEHHDWQNVNVDLEPSCDQTGKKTVRCADCEFEDMVSIPKIAHTDTCQGSCDKCGATIAVKHESEGCTSTECKKCGTTVSAKAHTASKTDPCDTSCTVCGAEDVIKAPHVHDIAQPCNNDCVKCGAEDVIPDAYDIGAAITRLDWVYPYTYAVHVANPNDPCDTTCASCGRPEAVRAVHQTPANPCTDTKCPNTDCYTNAAGYTGEGPYAHYRQGVLVNAPHVRPTPITGNENVADNKSPETNNYACKWNCAICKATNVLSFNHYFTDCSDTICDCCGEGAGWPYERAHRFTAESPTECVDCGTMLRYRVNNANNQAIYDVTFELEDEPCTHSYDNDCDVYCNDCNYQRYGWQGPVSAVWHIFENSCDDECNFCGETRTIEHTYPEECTTKCTVCGNVRETTVPHTYSNALDAELNPIENSSACDTTCDVCGEIREVKHHFAAKCSKKCLICQIDNPNIEHTYTDDCDSECDIVGCIDGTREAPHKYDYVCDETCRTCGATNADAIDHIYGATCDTTCNRGCGFVRTGVKHAYDNVHDATCNTEGCDFIRTAETDSTFAPDHTYDNACDATCNACGATREASAHVYDNDCDKTCNVCNAERTVADHVYGNKYEKSAEGTKVYTCTKCGYKNDSGEKAGLSGGAIAGIIAGSVAVAGGGGFSIYWFIFRKKRI